MKSAGTQMCSYNYIGDCASAIITVLINGKCGEAYNTARLQSRVARPFQRSGCSALAASDHIWV